ncbi:hypothetical protein BRC83_02845 [Halobacteriales archaeon QS_1_68_17]|nr:MAG: hypothetical protein BRC83_02845 [Halobacteriales archaeon QS_1_68_17]
MWGARNNRDDSRVTCIACGETIDRADAREYDKHGDRWSRRDKKFEYLCKPCHRDLCHQPRSDLEAVLEASGAGETDRDAFLERYATLVEGGHGSPEERER